LLGDLRGEIVAATDDDAGRTSAARYRLLLDEFCRDWRQLCALHGVAAGGRLEFAAARDALRQRSRALGDGLVMRTNGVAAHQVLEGRLLRHVLAAPPAPPPRRASPAPAPVFIVAAPRSGSTLLYETLATHGGIATLG